MDILRTLKTQLIAKKDKAGFALNCILAEPTVENALTKAADHLEEFSKCIEQLKLLDKLINQDSGHSSSGADENEV